MLSTTPQVYYAHYRDGDTTLLQATLRFGAVVPESGAWGIRWWRAYLDIMTQLVASPGIELAFRIGVRQGQLERMLLTTVNEERKRELDGALGLFAVLNELLPGSVEFCADHTQHDAMLASCPAERAWVQSEPYPCHECLLVHDFRVSSLVEKVFAIALEEDWTVALQLNLCRYRAGGEDLRQVRRNLVRVEMDEALPSRMVALQKRIMERLPHAGFLVDEFMAVEDRRALSRLWEPIEEEFSRSMGSLGFPPLKTTIDHERQFDGQLLTGFHSSWFVSPEPLLQAAAAMTERETLNVLAWRPPEWWAASLLRNTLQVVRAGAPSTTAGAREPRPGGRSEKTRVFISAKSADYPHAQRVYEFLVLHGVPTFFSQETLPKLGSSDYRKEIDRSLDEAQHMVVVTSSVENVQSSWVEAEWGFFINEKRSGRKSGNLLTLVLGGPSAAELPPSLRYYEVIPFDEHALERVLQYVTS